jgi:hypothetical protein
MPKHTIAYRPWLLDRLGDPEVAIAYITGILRDSSELFPKAVKKVAEARALAISRKPELR